MRSITLFFCSVIFFLTPCLLSGQVEAKNKVNPVTPCCSILSIGPVDGIVLVRNNTTGRTFMFTADASAWLVLLKSTYAPALIIDGKKDHSFVIKDGGITEY